ncbi:calcium-binding protein [Novosphingobium cyanobacteriorum]|uniref:Calcium-binding protein n=1 Tax=Novosphingobium cyanobacteriorum TaxID=3024215 RepID=A0ABT6CE59_9SPHN|nr:calcium-binding protein [Novosphingobium cyanobacteriorum]MDF8331748.1 calcium-binding protein [Novosphingobium cyanobacteriorum]
MSGSSNLFKFTVSGSDVTMYKLKKGVFVVDSLDANQSLSYDADTGNVTLKETYADHIELKLFQQTPSTTDDPSIYVKGAETYTSLDGTVIVQDDYDRDGNDDDVINGSIADDKHHGGRGNDNINGGRGDDDLNGDDGDDSLVGATGDDSLHGGHGDDHLVGGSGNDHESGDDGSDNMQGNGGDDLISGGAGDDKGSGGNGADDINGDDGDDSLKGGADDDSLDGGNDDDKLDGGTGDDDLTGGSGRDTLKGGDGADTFIFANGDTGGTRLTADRIADFSHAQGDHVDLSAVDADTLTDGDQAFTFIGTAAFGSHAGELRYSVFDGKSFVSGDTDGDGVANFMIRMDHVTTLVAEDFVL